MDDRKIDIKIALLLGAEWINLTPKGRNKVLIFKGGRPMITKRGEELTFHGFRDTELPCYTASLDAAWPIVEFMAKKGFMLTLMNWSYYGDKSYSATFRNSDLVNKEWKEYAAFPAKAVCLAALAVA